MITIGSLINISHKSIHAIFVGIVNDLMTLSDVRSVSGWFLINDTQVASWTAVQNTGNPGWVLINNTQ